MTAVTLIADGPTADGLLDRLPLAPRFDDFHGQEKLATLDLPLTIRGVPARFPAGIGCHRPDQVLVLSHREVARHPDRC